MAVDQNELNANYAVDQQALNANFAIPQPPRGALGEIGTGVKRGALVDLPSMAGRALQYVSTPGGAVSNFGQGMVQSAEARGQRGDLTLHPEDHNAITNALASGGEMLAPVVPTIAAGGAAALAGLPGLAATGVASLAGGALFGAEAGQRTLEKAKAAGVDDAAAHEAARLNAATTMAGQTALGMVGGKLLGAFGRPLSSIVARDGESLAASTLSELTGSSGVVSPFLKALPGSAAEAVGANAAQAAGSAAIERSYGIDNTSPTDAAMESVAPTLGLTALMGPLALVSRAMNVRAAKTRADSLSNGATPDVIRSQLADAYAARLEQVDPAAAQTFRENAAVAIQHKLNLPVDASVLSPEAVTAPAEPATPAPPPRLSYEPQAGTMFVGADGSVGTRADFEAMGMNEAPGVRRQPDLAPEPPPAPSPSELASQAAEQELQDLHGQVRQGLLDAGLQPAAPLSRAEFAADAGKGMKGQDLERAYREYLADPETQRNLMARDAEAHDALQKSQAAEEQAANQPRNPPPEGRSELPPEQPGNPAMADAMIAAIKKRDEARAQADRDAQKARETDAIANITKGAELAEAAERGDVRPDPNAPKGLDEVQRDWRAAMDANDMDTRQQSLVPLMKRLDAMGFDKFETHQQQIDALEQIAGDKKVSQGQRDRAAMLVEAWKKDMPATEKPAVTPVPAGERASLDTPPPAGTQAALGENIPPATPEKPAIPGEQATTSVAPSNLPIAESRMPVTDMATAAADRVAALRAEFNQRIRSGEKLSPLEQERYDDLNGMARSLQPYLEGRAKPRDAEFVKALAGMVDDASEPYKKSMRADRITGPVMTDPEQPDRGLLAPAAMSGKAADVMAHLADNGSQQWVKDLAARLQKILPNTRIEAGGPGETKTVTINGREFTGDRGATYNLPSDTMTIFDAGASEASILHEATHAATLKQMVAGEELQNRTPKNQEEARLKTAYADLKKVYEQAARLPGAEGQYGMKSPEEFVAELHSNAQFRDFLRQKSLWGRVVDAVRRMLGMAPKDTTTLDRAMDAADPFFADRKLPEQFDATPDGAAYAMGTALDRVLRKTDDQAFSIDTARVALGVLQKVLPLQTTSYIGHRMRTNPEMVSSGLSAGVDAHLRANTSHEVVLQRMQDVGSKFADTLNRTLAGMDPKVAQDVQRQMMTIGGEASRIGFDYRKNGRDNLAADKSLSATDKDYIDTIHRQWTQLQRTHPEAAALLEDGERLNRRSLIEKVATVATNMMDDRAGRARHLQAELDRMAPDDARRAELENRVRLVTTESLMAQAHSKGLDLMDSTLQQGVNPDPARFHDTATANLGNRLAAAFKAASQLPDGSPLRSAMGALESMYAQESKNPYFSLGRDGEYFVKVGFKGVDAAANARIQKALEGTNKVVGDLTRGDDHAFFRVDSAQQAERLHDALVAAGEGKVVDTAWGKLAEKTQEAASASPALRTLLSSVDDMQIAGPQAEQVKEMLRRQMLSMLPETSARSASMGRRGIPGYDANFAQQFARRAAGAVHDTAGVYTSRAYMAAQKMRADAIEQLNRNGSADGRQRAQLVDDEINKRYAADLTPVPADWVGRVTSLSHSAYLGASPAFFIRTAAQPWHRGLPFLGSKFGFMGAMGEMARAVPTAMKLVGNSVKNAVGRDGMRGLLNVPMDLEGIEGLTPRERAWVDEAHANGKLDLGQSAQLLRMALGPGDRKLQDAMRYASVTAQYTEMSNRFAIGLAALRLAIKRPQLLAAHETPETYALRAMELTMDDFSPSNTARAIGRHGFAGPLTPLFTQFQNYNLQTMQQIARTVHDGFFGQDKSPEGIQRAKEAKREFAGLMATTAVITGALGMPFANAFAGVYNSLMTDKDDPKDVRISIRNWANTTFGPDVAAVLTKGLPAALNLDTSTFGLQNLLPGSDFLADRTLWKERSEAQARNMLGPAVSLGLDLTDALAKIHDGQIIKGIEAALPVGLRTFYKTAEMAGLIGPGGYTDSKNNPIPLQAGASDLAWRALGFQTESKALEGDAQRDFIINQERRKNRVQNITDDFIKGTRDPSRMPDAVSEMMAYNAKNPTEPITNQDVRKAIAGYYTRFALGQATGIGAPVTKRALPALSEQERFAAMPGR